MGEAVAGHTVEEQPSAEPEISRIASTMRPQAHRFSRTVDRSQDLSSCNTRPRDVSGGHRMRCSRKLQASNPPAHPAPPVRRCKSGTRPPGRPSSPRMYSSIDAPGFRTRSSWIPREAPRCSSRSVSLGKARDTLARLDTAHQNPCLDLRSAGSRSLPPDKALMGRLASYGGGGGMVK